MTAAVASQVGVGIATAAPTAPDGSGALVTTPINADQSAALRDAVQRSRVQAALPAAGRFAFYLQLDAQASGRVFTDAAGRGQAAAREAARAAKARIGTLQDALIRRLPAGSTVLYRTAAVSAGLAITTDVSNYQALFTMPGVTAVHPIAPKTLDNAGVAELIKAPQVWEALGNTGQGVDVGIIDTGIDYTHTDFGGSGDVAQYDAIHAHEAEPAPAGVFPNAKVVGGYDFVGDAYDGSPASIPRPDPNPLDCNGHGSHVAGTAAGYGVNADGTTYTGSYDTNLDLKAMRIGPGMAPQANLWALRVFGCEGSTNVIGAAMEWALDPNGDGSTDDKLDVVNQSLGSTYGIVDDADGILAGDLQAQGVMMVFSAGNSGDVYNVDGSPGNYPSVLSVAASDDGFSVFDGWEITNQPDLFDPDIRPGLRSVLYEGTGDVTGDLTLPVAGDDPAACSPLSGDYTGKFLIIQADGFACGSITKSGNAKAAGADGFVIVSDDDSLTTGINGDPDIPGILVRATDGQTLIDALNNGETLTIHFGDSLAAAATVTDPSAVDTLAGFSSRGTRQSVKPDVTAPGVNTTSASVGTGDQSLTISGTSMAAPVISGVSALIRHQNPDWTTEQVKADVMNTAVHDLSTEGFQSGAAYAPNRVGSGRVDAEAALNNKVLAYVADEFSVISASFGVVEVSAPTATLDKTITVDNQGDTAATYNLNYQPITAMPGVTYSLSQPSITVPANSTGQFTITMTANRDQMRKTIDQTVSPTQVGLPRQYVADASGRITLTPTAGGTQLRVPVHANPKPVSDLTQNAFRTGGNTGVIQLDGRGVKNGYYGHNGAWVSTVSAFSLLGTSPELPQCTGARTPNCVQYDGERSVDLANVGVTSDAALSSDPYLYFGVGIHGTFPTPAAFSNYSVYIDATGDGQWDYQLLTDRFYDGVDPVDVPIVIGADREGNLLPSNDAPAITFLNVAPGTTDTNSFDSDFVIMPFPVSALAGITAGSSRFSFGAQATNQVGTIDNLGTTTGPDGGPELAAQTMSYDALAPSLSFNVVGYAQPAIIAPSADNTQIRVRANFDSFQADRALGGPKGIMLIHSHNPTGERVQTVTLNPTGSDVFGGLRAG